MGVWPAGRTSGGRVRICCVMDCWPAPACAFCSGQLSGLKFRSLAAVLHCICQHFASRQQFWPFGTSATKQLRTVFSALCNFRSYFRWRACL